MIARKAIEAAKAGDMVAIRLVLDRICPPRKSRPIQFDLPLTKDAAGVADAQQAILQATANGELLLDEAEALSVCWKPPGRRSRRRSWSSASLRWKR